MKFYSKRGIAVHTMVLVMMMAMFAGVAIFLLYKFTSPAPMEATKIVCELKKVRYCADWSSNDYVKSPWEWDEKNPKDCTEFNIRQPTVSECTDMLEKV